MNETMKPSDLPWSIRSNTSGTSCQLINRFGDTIAVFCDYRNAEAVLEAFAEISRLEENVEELDKDVEVLEEEKHNLTDDVSYLKDKIADLKKQLDEANAL